MLGYLSLIIDTNYWIKEIFRKIETKLKKINNN